jgi:type IV secretory pathway component VirB8
MMSHTVKNISGRLRRLFKEALWWLLIIFIAVALAAAIKMMLLASFKRKELFVAPIRYI